MAVCANLIRWLVSLACISDPYAKVFVSHARLSLYDNGSSAKHPHHSTAWSSRLPIKLKQDCGYTTADPSARAANMSWNLHILTTQPWIVSKLKQYASQKWHQTLSPLIPTVESLPRRLPGKVRPMATKFLNSSHQQPSPGQISRSMYVAREYFSLLRASIR